MSTAGEQSGTPAGPAQPNLAPVESTDTPSGRDSRPARVAEVTQMLKAGYSRAAILGRAWTEWKPAPSLRSVDRAIAAAKRALMEEAKLLPAWPDIDPRVALAVGLVPALLAQSPLRYDGEEGRRQAVKDAVFFVVEIERELELPE